MLTHHFNECCPNQHHSCDHVSYTNDRLIRSILVLGIFLKKDDLLMCLENFQTHASSLHDGICAHVSLR
jgi:hypothetical protein